MKAISRVAIAFAIIVGVVAILSNQSVDAVPLPTENEYVVGPFEAVGFGVVEAEAHADAWGILSDQFYEPGGHIETFVGQGLSIVSLDITGIAYDSPEYGIMYTITVSGPNPPIGNPGNNVP